MIEFCIGTLVGLFLGIFIMAIFQANRNNEDIARAEYAIRLAEYWKKRYLDEIKK